MDNIKVIKDKLKAKFDMKELGPAKKILVMNIERDRLKNHLFLNKKSYVQKILSKFSMSATNLTNVPLGNHFKLPASLCPQTEEEKEDMNNVPYESAIGSVMYVMIYTRADLAHAISILSRYLANPGRKHWEALQSLLKYLKGTCDVGLMFIHCKEGVILKGYVDSDYTGDRNRTRSTSSYVFTLCNNCISWKSRLQSRVAIESTEAEYIATAEAIK
nr:secreted RxLR effector protein 161-like [Ziziphus jujuba var. spinosa]